MHFISKKLSIEGNLKAVYNLPRIYVKKRNIPLHRFQQTDYMKFAIYCYRIEF